jgi:hypothetical protein
MTDSQFTVRYRQRTHGSSVALLVEDAAGDLHVLTAHHLHPYLRRSGDSARRASTLNQLGWVRVPQVAPYNIDGLRRLLAPASDCVVSAPV